MDSQLVLSWYFNSVKSGICPVCIDKKNRVVVVIGKRSGISRLNLDPRRKNVSSEVSSEGRDELVLIAKHLCSYQTRSLHDPFSDQ